MLPALILGTVLAIGALMFVLYPVFFGSGPLRARRARAQATDPVAVLREIEFDRATGKLSDADYAALRAAYGGQALDQLRLADKSANSAMDDVAEEFVRRMRRRMSCPACGPRPERDATWCSNCGAYLPVDCDGCGGEVRERGARFCSRCGEQLAA